MDVEIVEVTPAEPELFAGWADAVREAYRYERPGVWWADLSELTVSFNDPSPFNRRIAAAAVVAGEVVGGAEVGLPLKENVASMTVELGVRPAHRRRGYGTQLLALVQHTAQAYRRVTVETEVNVPAGQQFHDCAGGAFALAHGLRSENVEDRFLLPMPYPSDQLQALEAGLPQSGDQVVSWQDRVPDEYLSAFATLRTQMNHDVPTGGLTREAVDVDVERVRLGEKRMRDAGWVSLFSLALAPCGAPVGYTELLVSRNEPEFVLQEDTLVLSAHRGRRLGLRLKCANLRTAMALPDALMAERRWLQTWTAQSNAAMQRTNREFGFQKVDEMHECEGAVAAL